MAEASEAWQNVRVVLRGRRERPSGGDIAYAIYAAVILAIVVVFPVIRAVAIGLSWPEVVDALSMAAVQRQAPAVLALLGVAAVALGRIRGPVLPRQSYIAAVVASPIPRNLTLRAAAWRASAAVAGVSALIAVTLVWAMALSVPAAINVPGAALFLLASTLAGLQLSTLWLIGQLGTRFRTWVLSVLVVISVAALVLSLTGASELAAWSGPWGWVVVVWAAVTGTVTPATLAALTLLAAGCLVHVIVIPPVLRQLTQHDLSRQASRWSAITALAVTGDVKSAAAKLKAMPKRGRHWAVTFPRHPVFALVLRDLIGIARFPARAAGWAATTTGSGALLALVLTQPELPDPLAFVVPVLAYFAVGGWASGLHLHGFLLAPGSPFGFGVRVRVVLHAIVPGVCAGALMVCGAVVVIALGVPVTGTSLLWIALLTVFFAVMQAFTSVKGPLPLELLTPIPTPLGDMSLLVVGAWLADAVLIVLLVAGTATHLLVGGKAVAVPILVVVTALMAWWTHGRASALIRAEV